VMSSDCKFCLLLLLLKYVILIMLDSYCCCYLFVCCCCCSMLLMLLLLLVVDVLFVQCFKCFLFLLLVVDDVVSSQISNSSVTLISRPTTHRRLERFRIYVDSITMVTSPTRYYILYTVIKCVHLTYMSV